MLAVARFARTSMALAVLAAPAYGQNDVCRDQNGNIDQNLSQGWQAFQANANPQAMQQIVGVWYNELPNPGTGQIAYRYLTYEPNGLFTMQTRVCVNGQACGDYPAHGFWAAQADQNGMLTVMTIVSDAQVTNYCSIAQAVLQGPTVMQNSQGMAWQRIQ